MPFSKTARPLIASGSRPLTLIDANEAVVLLALFGAAHLAFDHVAAAQFEAANLRLADVDVVVADDVAAAPQEAVALGKDVEDAARHLDARALLLRGEDRATISSFFMRRRIAERDLVALGDLDQFGLLLVFELSRG